MKNIMMGIVGMMFLILVTVSALGVYSLGARKNEISNSLSEAMLSTAGAHYTYGNLVDNDFAAAELKEYLEVRLGSDSKKEIEIGVCDMEKGILSVAVTEQFLLPQGELKSIKVVKTLIRDKHEIEPQLVQIRFWDGEQLYKVYELPKGQNLWELKRPETANKKWGGWKNKDGKKVTLSSQIAKEDTDYYAFYKE